MSFDGCNGHKVGLEAHEEKRRFVCYAGKVELALGRAHLSPISEATLPGRRTRGNTIFPKNRVSWDGTGCRVAGGSRGGEEECNVSHSIWPETPHFGSGARR